MPQARSTVELVEAVGGTRLTIRARYATPAELTGVLDMGMIAGITETLDRLDEHLADLVSPGHRPPLTA
jgi:hypothetical protein